MEQKWQARCREDRYKVGTHTSSKFVIEESWWSSREPDAGCLAMSPILAHGVQLLYHRVVCWLLLEPSLIPKLTRLVCKRRDKEGRTGFSQSREGWTGFWEWLKSKMASISGVQWLLELSVLNFFKRSVNEIPYNFTHHICNRSFPIVLWTF